MPAALGAVVDPDRGHAERFGRLQVAGHVLHEKGGLRVDGMALAQGGVGSRIRLGHIIHCMDVVHPVEGVGETEFLEYAGSIGFIAVGRSEETTSELQALMRRSYA